MKYSSLMHVPSTGGGRLIKLLSKAEPRIAKASGYQVKMVECSGKPLSNFFSKNPPKKHCHRAWCAVCTGSDHRGSSRCGLKSVVYKAVCQLCDHDHKKDPSVRQKGIYVGQTCRTQAERAKEHRNALRDFDVGSFMFKHWVIEHKLDVEPPKFQFSVVEQHKDPLSRMIHEAVAISEEASLNSKAEWRGYKITRLEVEKTSREKLKDLESEEPQEWNVVI